MNAKLTAAARAALDAADVEAGLSLVTRAAMEHLGDPEAGTLPGDDEIADPIVAA